MHAKRRMQVYAIFAMIISLVASATPAQATFTILGPFPIITTTYGVGSIPIVPPTTNSPAPWVFTSSNSKVAIISGKSIAVVGAGTSTITASQAATGNFSARSRATQIRVTQGTPILGAFAAQSFPITQRTFTLVPPTSTSNGGWTFISANPNIASIVGTKVTFHAAGTTVIYANQGLTPNWKSASASMKITINAIVPVVGTFGDITIMKDSVVSLSLNPPASTSPGFWSFTSSNPNVASVASNVLTPHAFGTAIITAKQDAYGDYASASATMKLTVQGPIPTLGAFPDVTADMTAAPFINLHPPTSTSTGVWNFTSSDLSIVATDGAIATLYKPGVVTITATQASTSTYASPTPVSMTLTVVGKPAIGPWPGIQKVVKDPDFSLVPPTSTSSGAWTYTSSNPLIAEVVDGIVKVKGAGETTITATQAATATYSSSSAQMTIQVFGAIPTLGAFAPMMATLGDPALVVKPPTSNSTGAWTFTSSNPKVAVVKGGALLLLGVGTATISATQASAGIYSQSNTVQATLTVKAKSAPSPTPLPSNKPTPTPTVKPTVAPTPTPTVSKPSVNQTLRVTASGRVLTVVAVGVKPLVFINGKPGKVGKNSVKPGIASIVITIDDKVVYRRVFSIK